jgi:hypothetical protein
MYNCEMIKIKLVSLSIKKTVYTVLACTRYGLPTFVGHKTEKESTKLSKLLTIRPPLITT